MTKLTSSDSDSSSNEKNFELQPTKNPFRMYPNETVKQDKRDYGICHCLLSVNCTKHSAKARKACMRQMFMILMLASKPTCSYIVALTSQPCCETCSVLIFCHIATIKARPTFNVAHHYYDIFNYRLSSKNISSVSSRLR